MFTGIIEEVGHFSGIKNGHIKIFAEKVLAGTEIGDSIAVNGVCLTVVAIGKDSFLADVMPETLRCTNLSSLSAGCRVNLERALPVNGRIGGHIVSGHVDGTGKIVSVLSEGNAKVFTVAVDSALMNYIVKKGSVSVDGVSLTVKDTGENSFSVSLIPHTVSNTVFQDKKCGDILNIEVDIIGRYIEKLLRGNNMKSSAGTLTREFLLKNGF